MVQPLGLPQALPPETFAWFLHAVESAEPLWFHPEQRVAAQQAASSSAATAAAAAAAPAPSASLRSSAGVKTKNAAHAIAPLALAMPHLGRVQFLSIAEGERPSVRICNRIGGGAAFAAAHTATLKQNKGKAAAAGETTPAASAATDEPDAATVSAATAATLDLLVDAVRSESEDESEGVETELQQVSSLAVLEAAAATADSIPSAAVEAAPAESSLLHVWQSVEERALFQEYKRQQELLQSSSSSQQA